MRIQKNSLTTFKSTPIYNVNLKRGDCGFVDAKFSKLNPNDEEDIDTMEKACVDWAGGSEFGIDICDDFLFGDDKIKKNNDL